MPPALAARFTQAEMAAFRIVSDEVRHHGVCALHIDAIAARAGTCRTTVKNALREARRLNLVTVQERRRRGQKSLTNLVRIVSPEWTAWIRIGGKKSTRWEGRTQNTGRRYLMTKARQHERQKRRQAEFITDEEQRLPRNSGWDFSGSYSPSRRSRCDSGRGCKRLFAPRSRPLKRTRIGPRSLPNA
jgi:hypothetical protein